MLDVLWGLTLLVIGFGLLWLSTILWSLAFERGRELVKLLRASRPPPRRN